MRRLIACALALAFALSLAPVVFADSAQGSPQNKVFLPAIALDAAASLQPPSSFQSLDDFAASVADGSQTLRGVYAPDRLALPIVQQPANDPLFVAARSGVLTQFKMAEWYGVVGLLAHNYLEGRLFFDLKLGDTVTLVYGDGARRVYVVDEILSYQALQPYSASSTFVDLATGQAATAAEVFSRAYTGGDQVTFQTCIARNGLGSWGRLFVIARPVD